MSSHLISQLTGLPQDVHVCNSEVSQFLQIMIVIVLFILNKTFLNTLMSIWKCTWYDYPAVNMWVSNRDRYPKLSRTTLPTLPGLLNFFLLILERCVEVCLEHITVFNCESIRFQQQCSRGILWRWYCHFYVFLYVCVCILLQYESI